VTASVPSGAKACFDHRVGLTPGTPCKAPDGLPDLRREIPRLDARRLVLKHVSVEHVHVIRGAVNDAWDGLTGNARLDHRHDAGADRFGQSIPSVDDFGQVGEQIWGCALAGRCHRRVGKLQLVVRFIFPDFMQRI
jgi:hypothetical protein